MIDEKVLTISIAAYNVKKTLDQLMQSIIDSKCMDDLEVLIINDGSKDSTEQIGADYQERYPDSIQLITKSNGGHGSTINKGIELATGKYFKAIDGDDWFNPKSLKAVVKKLKDTDSDLVVTDFEEHYTDCNVKLRDDCRVLEHEKVSSFDDICDALPRLLYHQVIFRTELLKDHHILLDEHCYYVDSEYVFYPLPFINTITYIASPLYCYRLGDVSQSMSPSSMQRNIAMHEKVNLNVAKYYEEHKEGLSTSRRNYLLMYVSRLNARTYEVLFSFPCNKEHRDAVDEYEETLKSISPESYAATTSRAINIYRKNSAFYPLVWLWLRIKRKTKGVGI
ncbi:MAG: glycosyltransferase family A protein [Catonella sp.]|nr:glycosyltransferase family A protein [Catonella sp.]